MDGYCKEVPMTTDWARPVVHWEITARDQAKMRDFYQQMFNWSISEGPISLVGAGIGAPEPAAFTGHILPGGASRVILYIQVLDLQESMAKAEQLGGAVVAKPLDVPGGPTISKIADPEGNHIGLVQQ
jgi:predicted enzyme related to lactoylglutathione lyase